MTTIAALIPRFRFQRSGRIVAIRCAACQTWRKPRFFAPNANTCHPCSYGAARRRVNARAARHG